MRLHARALGLLALFAVGIFLVWVAAPQSFRYGFEDATYIMDSTPARAFAYGERHFNASYANEYDIARAEYFFELALNKDPSVPYLYHQLARISFLRGKYRTALAQIDFQISMHGDSEPSSYYVRGLIEGYMGRYDDSVRDYQHFLQFDPHDWAAINDYSWVLLKADRPAEAVVASAGGLSQFPDNAWLLNTNAIGLYEIGLYEPARVQARKALEASSELTEAEWLSAYPGNDPTVAAEGIAALQASALQNMHTITVALASSTIQSSHE